MKVLIIEDDIVIAATLAIFLDFLYIECTQASTLAEGLEKLSYQVPDILILDLLLGSKSGIPILQAARQQKLQMKIIVLSASTDLGKISALYPECYFIRKPFDLEDLERVILPKLVPTV